MTGEFSLYRHEDETGISGTGRVAQGFVFEDGMVVLRWLTDVARSIGIYHSIEDVVTLHGHEGRTEVLWES